MAKFHVLVHVVAAAPLKYYAIAGAITKECLARQVRQRLYSSQEEAAEGCDVLVGALCTELRAQGHEISSIAGEAYTASLLRGSPTH